MSKKIRRDDRSISAEEAEKILTEGEYGVLSTVGQDAQPYGVPVSYAYKNNSIYFHSATEGHKIDNMLGNPNVSFCVVGNTKVLPNKFGTEYESAIVFGEALELTDDDKRQALVLLLKKYSSDHLEKGLKYIENLFDTTRVFGISVNHITGKARRQIHRRNQPRITDYQAE